MPTITNLWRNRAAPGAVGAAGTTLNTAGTAVTSGAGAFGTWTTITATGPSALFSINSVAIELSLATRAGAFQIGYGPAGAERVVFEGPLNVNVSGGGTAVLNSPILSAPIPAGSRVALRSYLGAATSYTYTVGAIRLDRGISPDTLIAHPDSFYVPAKSTAGNFGTSSTWSTVVADTAMVYPLTVLGAMTICGGRGSWDWGTGTTTAQDVLFSMTPAASVASVYQAFPFPVGSTFPAGKSIVGRSSATLGAASAVPFSIRADLPVYRLGNVSPSIYEY